MQSVSVSNTYQYILKTLKNIQNVKDVGMACQKVCKQGRDDIIVK